jgi:1-acyl-sn-glycerol-3-phosphate acyltransferase
MPLELDVPPISGITLRFFVRIVRSHFRRHFRSVMVQHANRLAAATGPLIVYTNHSSWWDPMTCILLAQTLLPGRRHYAPMDAEALARSPLLRKLGIFPVEMTTPRGAAQFLRKSQAILREGGVLWVTPQGRFADPRQWPLGFKPGLAALVRRMPEAQILPLAIEYTFWDEQLPEALLHIAPPVEMEAGATTEGATRQLETELAAAMLALQTASIARDAHAFQTLLRGSRGTGGWYVWGRRLRAIPTGRKVRLNHTLHNDL